MESFLVRNGLVPHLIAGIFFLVVAILLLENRERSALITRLQSEGQVTSAVIVRTSQTYKKIPNRLDYKKITARYVVAAKHFYFEKDIYVASDTEYADLQVGDQIELAYLAEDPTKALMRGETAQKNNWTTLLILSSAGVFFGVLFKAVRPQLA